MGYKPVEITNHASIFRYTRSSAYTRSHGDAPGNDEALIRNGLYYHEQWEADAGVYVAYDRDHGRAYFHSHTR